MESTPIPQIHIERFGVTPYNDMLNQQHRYHQEVVSGARANTVILCSHQPVYTIGTSTKGEHLSPQCDLTVPPQHLNGIDVVKVSRGGSVTYHGPEQLVCYPILNLNHFKRDIGWYMRSLEEVVIRTLNEYGIQGTRIPGKAGVWTSPQTKVAFCGVKVSRWCTYHGFSLNVHRCADKFQAINPCGLGPIRVISLEELTSNPIDANAVTLSVIAHFTEVFGGASRPSSL